MLEAMLRAPVGDAVFGDDPTVLALEDEVASLLRKEAALFVASGTMSNQLALRVHVGQLDEVLCDHRAHIHVWENGGIHAISGASVAPVIPPNGDYLCADDVASHASLSHFGRHRPVTRLLALENTLNGAVASVDQLGACAQKAHELGLATHLDGARLWNAAVAEARGADEFAQPFDSVSVCLSKGLGAPVGSVLAGSTALVERARHFCKLYGGGWRQAGILAAAGLHALHHHRERLAEDHERASELADGLTQLGFDVDPPMTNMVWCHPPPAVRGMPHFDEMQRRLEVEDGILVGGAYGGARNPFGQSAKSIRFVTHMQTPREGVLALLGGIRRLLRK